MFYFCGSAFPSQLSLSAQHPIKAHILFFGTLLASFRPSSDINCEWMQTLAEEYGAEEACHILSPLGRTFNLLTEEQQRFKECASKICTCTAFSSHTARPFERSHSIWSKWHHTDCRCPHIYAHCPVTCGFKNVEDEKAARIPCAGNWVSLGKVEVSFSKSYISCVKAAANNFDENEE